MGLRIKTNVESLVAQRNLEGNRKLVSESLEKLSSGLRINKSADDAAGLAISENIRAKVRGLNQAKRNASDGISYVQVAEGGLNEISNILIRMKELAVQGSSDTIGDSERGFLDKEYQGLYAEIDRIANSSEFGGLRILNGTASGDFNMQVGDSTEEFDRIVVNFEGLNATTDAIQLSASIASRDDSLSVLDTINGSLKQMSDIRAFLGSTQSRLNSAISNLSIQVENFEAAKSRIRDVDFAAETANLTQANILSASTTAVLSQANATPEIALSLLNKM